MNDQNPRATMGANNPPDPLDAALSPYSDDIAEAEGWLDGQPVTNEAQMKAVDALIKQIKAAEKDVTGAQKSEAAPYHDAWKAALARYKPTLDDLDRLKRGLIAAVDGFKRKLAADKAEAERKAREEAEKAALAAREAALKADAANIEAQREAARLQAEAEAAQKAAAAASKDAGSVKGLRTVTRYEITDYKALLNWIARNDRDAITAFIDEYARREHTVIAAADGIRVWKERVAV